MTRKEINSFISKYLDDNGKPFEVLTEFRHYNVDLINKDKEKIISFFCKIYNFSREMSFEEFKTSKEGKLLYELELLYDLDEFENLIGLLFASGILIDNLVTRFDLICLLGNNTKYLNRNLNEEDNYREEDYVSYLDKYLLHLHRFNVNETVIRHQKEISEKKKVTSTSQVSVNYTNKEIKDILTFWFLKNPSAANFISFFKSLLETKLEAIFNYAVLMETERIEAQSILIVNILSHTHIELLEEIEKKYSELSLDTIKELNQYKLDFLEKISREMQEKNRRL